MSISLPNTYQRVYYIQSSGTQWLDTGHKHTNNSSYELIVSFYTAPTKTYQKVFGAATSNYSSSDCIQLEADNNEGAFHFRTVWYSEYGKNFGNISLGKRYRILMNNTSSFCYDYDNGELIGNNTYTGSTLSSSKSDYLFTVNSSETSSQACSCRIYSFKIYSSGKLVCNLVPCYRKSDNVIGMYDLVNDSFKTNIGSGTFTKSDDLNDLSYKNFKLYLGRNSETHEEWRSHTVTNYAFTYDIWLRSYSVLAQYPYKHFKRKLLGASDNISDAAITSYSLKDALGFTPKTAGCQVITENGNTYVEIYFSDNSSSSPTGYTTTASYTYSAKEIITVYNPEIYSTIIMGNQIFNIKSDADIIPIPPYVGPSIDDISLNAYMDGSTELRVEVDNLSDYEIDVVVKSLSIDTSSASYDESNWENQGSLYTPIPSNISQESLLYFSDGCALENYGIDFEFFYSGVSLGVLHVDNYE